MNYRLGKRLISVFLLAAFVFTLMPVLAFADAGIFEDNGEYYYLDAEGVPAKNQWITVDGTKYFAGPTGAFYKDMLIHFGGTSYYMGSDGSVQSGLIAYNGNYYYADPGKNNAIAKSTWVNDGTKKYFAGPTGAFYKDMFIHFSGTSYYMGPDGSVQSGLISYNGNYYYADPGKSGIIAKNTWVNDGGKRYFAGSSGAFYKNTLIHFGGTSYYMGADGSVQSGFVFINGNSYYADPGNNGIIVKNSWVNDGTKKYFAGPTGAFYKDMIIRFGNTSYYMQSDGSLAKGVTLRVGDSIYDADASTGLLTAKTGWINQGDGKRFFADSNGKLYKNQFINFGNTTYYMGSDGSVQMGIFQVGTSYYYGDPTEKGAIRKGAWVEDRGTKFFAGPTGAFYHNQFIKFGDIYYYLNTNGSVVKTPFMIRGYTVNPNPTTGVISKSDYLEVQKRNSPYNYSEYVLVSIKDQTLRYFVNGIQRLECYVVTGNTGSPSTITPKGTFRINSKIRNALLRGYEEDGTPYESYVSYWMPFIGQAYGLHDAAWREYFGGSIYLYGGSHGCVNMPYAKAEELFNMVSVGCIVVIE